MPKKKKTRKQKELADVRRQTVPSVRTETPVREARSRTSEEPVVTHVISSSPQKQLSSYEDYKYLGKDLRKTIVLTTAIITIELILKFGTGL